MDIRPPKLRADLEGFQTRPRTSPTFRGISDRSTRNIHAPVSPVAAKGHKKRIKFNVKNLIRTHMILIGGVLITAAIGLFVLQKIVSAQTVESYAAQRAKAAEIQSTLANLPDIANLNPGHSTDGAYLINRYQSTVHYLEETSLDKPNILQRLLSPADSTLLNNDFEDTRRTADEVNKQLVSINEQLKSVLKYIEYNPGQDYIEFGKNKTTDDEHIEVTKQGFLTTQRAINDTVANTPGTASSKQILKDQLQLALTALETFKLDRKIEAFAESVLQTQLAMIEALQIQLDKAVETYQSIYQSLK